MSFLSGVTELAVSGIWKVAAIGLLVGMVASSAYLGYEWHMAAHDRDQARGELVAARAENTELRVGITAQNVAVDALAVQKIEAEARGVQAQQVAAANGRRFDQALEQMKNAKAKTCADAMPAVNAALEAIR
jgi:hypothetical protein